MSITVSQLRERFNYDPVTGIFTWKKIERYHGHREGKIAGCLHKIYGYWLLTVDNKKIRAHIAAWMHYHGKVPTSDIDHKDLNKSNNKIINLRLSNKSNNGANRPAQTNNTSGHKGVFWHKKASKWMVQIKVRNDLIYGGLFESKKDAARHYDHLAEKYFGEHARLNLRTA